SDSLRKRASAGRGWANTSTPRKRTEPAVGWSSAPSRCRKVDLPTPDAPTIATRSPGARSKSTPESTSISPSPVAKRLTRPRTSTSAAAAAAARAGSRTGEGSLIPERLHRIEARALATRDEGAAERQRHGDGDDERDLREVELGGELGDALVDRRRQRVDPGHRLHLPLDPVEALGDRDAGHHADRRADEPDQRPLDREDVLDRVVGRAHR